MKRKIAAIMAADVAGYSRLVAEDEEETVRRLFSYRSIVDELIAKASGRICNTAGDSVLAEFSSAVEAVRCAIDIQESLRTRNAAHAPSRQMNFRIGITVGDVIERDGDLLGDAVNIAARLEALAEPGCICVSRSVYEQVGNKVSVKFADIGELQVKNIPTRVHAYRVEVRSPDAEPVAASPAKTSLKSIRASLIALFCLTVIGSFGFAYWRMSAPSAPTSMPATGPRDMTLKRAEVSPSIQRPYYDEEKVRSLAARQNMPLPETISLSALPLDLPRGVGEYLGAWGGNNRWGGQARNAILLVTNINQQGEAVGFYSFGPPNSGSFNQSPAAYFAFKGVITDLGLQFDVGRWKHTYKIRADGIMMGRIDDSGGRVSEIAIERIN